VEARTNRFYISMGISRMVIIAEAFSGKRPFDIRMNKILALKQ
jgi:hypothetical protein